MRVRRANKLMISRHGADLAGGSVSLPDRLSAILAWGLNEQDGCVLLAASLEKSKAVGREDFPDKTGYECFVNHLHIDDFVDSNVVCVAVALLAGISDLLGVTFPHDRFRGLLSSDDIGATVRFHRVRIGEEWLSGDLEGYAECVCEYDL